NLRLVSRLCIRRQVLRHPMRRQQRRGRHRERDPRADAGMCPAHRPAGAPHTARQAALALTRNEADVAVIGLGAMGAMSAWRLAARGARVVGFERYRPGHDRGSSHGDTRIFRTAYFESPEYVPLLQRAHILWRQLEKESGVELLTMTGGLTIGRPDGELVSGVLASARLNDLPHRLLDGPEMGRAYPQHRMKNGEVAVLEDEAG